MVNFGGIDIPQERLEAAVVDYTAHIETAETGKVCKCLWAVHPDDVEVTSGTCRECAQVAESHTPEGDHHFKGKRMRLFEQDKFCPAHTREGFLLGFLDWMDKHNG